MLVRCRSTSTVTESSCSDGPVTQRQTLDLDSRSGSTLPAGGGAQLQGEDVGLLCWRGYRLLRTQGQNLESKMFLIPNGSSELWSSGTSGTWSYGTWNSGTWNSGTLEPGTWNRSRFGCTLRSSAALTAFSPPAERRKPFGWSVQTVYMVPTGEERGGGRGGSVGGADCPDVLRWPLQDM